MMSRFKGPVRPDFEKNYKIEDLLHREPATLATENSQQHIFKRRILITGASGSIGSELAKQIAPYHPSELILIDKCEGALTSLEMDLRRQFVTLNINIQMADISDEVRITHIFAKTRPHVVYHAAALKHVPFVEKQPYDAIKTNVLGTKILADVSSKMNVEKFIFVSTDKAVNPSSLMGITKRFGEIIMATQSKYFPGPTQFVTARFGNVLGSSGSVVTVFEDQIKQGGPLTLTHQEMKRYFMTTSEASQLLLQAGSTGKDGQILIFRMGDPVHIYNLALDLIKLHGLKPYTDIDIQFCGIRPGEKLSEELVNANDNLLPSHHPDIITASVGNASIVDVEKYISEIRMALMSSDLATTLSLIKSAVPEYNCTSVPEVME